MPVWVPQFIASYVRRLLANALRSSRLISLGRFSPAWRYPYPASRSLGTLTRYYARYGWNRRRLPLYSSFGRSIPVARVVVPAGITYTWSNPDQRYPILPQITLARARATSPYRRLGLLAPDFELQAMWPPQHKRPEWSRRRHDSKVPGWYNELLTFANRFYGPVSELGDLYAAIFNNLGSFPGILNALALERAVDIAFGARARFLKEHVYGSYWNLPFGLDTTTRLWDSSISVLAGRKFDFRDDQRSDLSGSEYPGATFQRL